MRDASLYKPCSKVPRRARKGNGNKTNQRDILLEPQFGYGSKLLNGAGGLRSQWVMNKVRIGFVPLSCFALPYAAQVQVVVVAHHHHHHRHHHHHHPNLNQ
jgi:hypothetical protein